MNTIYKFIKSFLDNKMPISEEYGTCKAHEFQIHMRINILNIYITKQKRSIIEAYKIQTHVWEKNMIQTYNYKQKRNKPKHIDYKQKKKNQSI